MKETFSEDAFKIPGFFLRASARQRMAEISMSNVNGFFLALSSTTYGRIKVGLGMVKLPRVVSQVSGSYGAVRLLDL